MLRERILRVFRNASEGDMFTLDDVAEEVKPARKDGVAFILGELASAKAIDQVVRVDSPAGGGIREYPSIDNIPARLYDPFQLQDIKVEPALVKVFFKKGASETRTRMQSSHRSHALV